MPLRSILSTRSSQELANTNLEAHELIPVYRQILAHADTTPVKAAIASERQSISYAELASRIRSIAAVLVRKFGVSAGDRIVMLADSNADFVCAYLAAHSIGAICVPLDPHTSDERLCDILDRVLPRIIVAESSIQQPGYDSILFSDLLRNERADKTFVSSGDVIDDQPADILFTTGTTGYPKGVVLSHRALAKTSAHINEFIQMRADAVEVLPLPLSHSFGLGRVRCVLVAGATLILTPGFVNSSKIVAAISKHRATGFASVPTGVAILLAREDSALGQFATQLTYLEIGSSAMPMQQKKHLMRLLPETRICMHYGLTEASRSTYLSFHDDKDKLESIGRPSPGVRLRIVDDVGLEVDSGIDGHIEIFGAHVMTEYWQDPELTAKHLHKNWLRTGDLGCRDNDGFFYLKARSSDIINVGGRKVAPQEIESILLSHPAVTDCACVGIPDPQGISGEIISAYLVADPDQVEKPDFSDLAKLLRMKLEPYKIPRRFTWIDAIPRSSSGKIIRRQITVEK
jgi:long-chain acyl-CoA synthetase